MKKKDGDKVTPVGSQLLVVDTAEAMESAYTDSTVGLKVCELQPLCAARESCNLRRRSKIHEEQPQQHQMHLLQVGVDG